MSKYIIEDETLTAIADKIREKKYIDDPLTPAQMVEEMDELGYSMDIDVDASCTVEPWSRPVEYPDPTVIDLTDFDGLYLTYDLRKTPGYGWIGVRPTTYVNADVYFERGHLEGTEFIVDETITVTTAGSAHEYGFRHHLDETYGDVQLWRVTTEDRFKTIGFCPNTNTTASNFTNQLQPCVERYGRLPYITTLNGSVDATTPSASAWATYWLLRDDVKDVTEITSMQNAYFHARNLREVHFDGWDTSKVTTFLDCFNRCFSLEHIPLEAIDTSSATSLRTMFYHCRCLDNVNINHFNIDKVTTMYGMFEGCRSLKHLEMSALRGVGKLTTIYAMFDACWSLSDIERNIKNLNTENVTNFQYVFLNCRSLKSLDLSSWNTSSVTNCYQMFNSCIDLEVVNLSGWDMTHVTSTASMFGACNNLKKIIGLEELELLSVTDVSSMFNACWSFEKFKIKTWDISALTKSNSMFYQCYSLKSVELQGWGNVPNVITSISSMFGYCESLKEIHLPNMNFTEPVGLTGVFANCYSLENLDISGWHVSNVLSFNEFFSSCYHLSEIDLSSWIVDSGEMTAKNTLNSVFSNLFNCRSIKADIPLEIVTSGTITYLFDTEMPLEYLDIRSWDLSKATNSNTPNIAALVDYYPPKVLQPVNQTYSGCRNITPDSLVRILEALPTVTTAHTITLGQYNKLKLTGEQLAIATNKGWTVA